MEKEQQQDLIFMLKTGGFAGTGKSADIFFRYSTSAALTRILGPNIFGVFILGRTIVWVASAISQMGMGLGVVRQIAFYHAKNEKNKLQQAIRLALLVCGFFSVIAAVVLFWQGDYISNVLFKKPALERPLKLLIFTIPIIGVSITLLDVLRGFKEIKSRVRVEYYFLPLANLFLILVFYVLDYRLEGAIAAFILSNFLSLILLVVINRRRIKLVSTPFLEKPFTFDFFKFSLPLMLARILGELKNRLDILFLGFLSTASNVGIFFIAFRLANLMSVPWQAFNMSFAPMVSGYFARGDLKKIEYSYKNITKLIFIFSMFFWGFLLVFSGELLSIFGSEFRKGALVVILICFGQVVKTLVGHAGPMLAMVGKPSLNLLITIISLILLALLNLLLIPRLGITGAGIANVTGVTVTCLLELFFIYRVLHIHPFRKDFFKPVFALLISGGVIYLTKTMLPTNIPITVFLAAAFTALYYISLYLQKLTEEEMVFFNKIKQMILARGR